jgi:putative transposase
VRYAFIKKHTGEFRVRPMCRVLKVHPSGYYAWVPGVQSPRARENEQLANRIQAFFDDSHGTYGSPRIYKDLRQAGYVIGENRVARIMRLHKIHAQRAYRKPRFRKASMPSRLFANHLNRQFSVGHPNRVWATDTTYIRTLQGWLFLTVVMDLYSRMVVGWAMRTDNHRDGPMDALFMAVKRRKPTHSVLIHSDQGSQFGSDDWARLCKALKLEPSMSRRGNCWDNAVAESFFSSLKKERTRDIAYRTIADARADVFDYIEGFYNRKRRHSTLGQLSPLEFENKKQAG